jgi:hypothetical protein
MKVLFFHDFDLRVQVGGAELTQRMAFDNPPKGVETDFCSYPDVTLERVKDVDLLVIANMFGCGDETENMEIRERALDIILESGTPYIKSEHDFAFCGLTRMVNCVTLHSENEFSIGECKCAESRMARFVGKLFAGAKRIRYLSPIQKSIFHAFGFHQPSFLAAPYIDYSIFVSSVPWSERPREAMVVGDFARGVDLSAERAEADGLEVDEVSGFERSLEEMAATYNEYKYLYLFPRTVHSFCRQAVEAHACGCKVVSSNRLGALSYGGLDAAVAASRTGLQDFWDNVLA